LLKGLLVLAALGFFSYAGVWLTTRESVDRFLKRSGPAFVAAAWLCIAGAVAAAGKWGSAGITIATVFCLPIWGAILTLRWRDLHSRRTSGR
jgi:hypothetical protein